MGWARALPAGQDTGNGSRHVQDTGNSSRDGQDTGNSPRGAQDTGNGSRVTLGSPGIAVRV